MLLFIQNIYGWDLELVEKIKPVPCKAHHYFVSIHKGKEALIMIVFVRSPLKGLLPPPKKK